MSVYLYSEDWSVSDILEASDKLEGKSLGELDKRGWLQNGGNKGRIGNMIQSDYFGIPANSDRGADFNYHGIELKVTPVKKAKTGKLYSSKERLVLGMINYMKDYKIDFIDSLPNKKTKRMLLIFYLHEENTQVNEFKILKSVLFNLPEEDKGIVKTDYEQIISMIKSGRAHEITEKDQKYLGACTKGQGKGKDLVKQPFSDEDAKSRAYSYKVGYMSSYFRKLMTPEEITHILVPQKKSFEETITSTLDKYIGKEDIEITKQTDCKTSKKSKSYHFDVMSSMFQTNGKNVNQTEEFTKEGYAIKTVRNRFVKRKNQDMSFPNLDFTELSYDAFEESSWYSMLAETKYVLAIWDEFKEGRYRFVGYKIWKPNQELIDQAERLFNHIQEMLQNDKVEVYNEGKTRHQTWSDNLPKKGVFAPFQIRPKGNGESVIVSMPMTGKEIKKKALFIDKKYIQAVLQ
ncbi:Sau3AI family type II restriction endonuclease [Vagococcus lutrae]|uniref:Sau3AI family type II restriction endonuclease n=1 Tax=Vagococcus lutrae TaxID=81947 RepID=UPI0023A9BCEB|nr:Sau3AI family type II restriction endonuclease [Vagococcus lutrae]WEB80845.1 hypothetical protein LVJ09_06460 [Vagococcus lutrae]